MANKKISELTLANPLAGAEVLPIVQDGVTRKATPDQLAALISETVTAAEASVLAAAASAAASADDANAAVDEANASATAASESAAAASQAIGRTAARNLAVALGVN